MSEARPRRVASHAWSALGLAWRAAPAHLSVHLAVTVLAALVPVASVWLLKEVLDALAEGGPVAPSAVGLAGAGVLAASLPALAQYLRSEVGRRTGRRAQSALYRATERLVGLARLEDPEFRDRLRLAQQAGRSGPGQVVDGVVGIGQQLVTIVGLAAVLATVSPLMAAVMLPGLAPAAVLEARLSRRRSRTAWKVSPVERREFFYAELQTSLAAAKEVRLLNLFPLFRRRMLTELAQADGERRRLDRRELGVQVVVGLSAALVLGVGLFWVTTAAQSGRITVGEVSAFIAAMTAVQAGLQALISRAAMAYQALLMYEHFQVVLDVPPDLGGPPDPKPVPSLRAHIELRDVWFRYGPDKPWVLRGVDLVIPHGAAVALVGLNGAGKSTLVKLLCRFYDPQRGTIRWDGVDQRELSTSELRDRIGVLFQDYMSYDLTAAENIGLGDVTALEDEERIRAAAGRAGIAATIERFPRGYRTLLSRMFVDPAEGGGPDTGRLLSGGQWQRLALARTMLRDRRDLLILDEPSSGLDAEAEHEIHHRLRRHRAGATSVLISHRLGAVRDADRIVVLGDGVVVEQGTHDELVAADGEYARLFRLQAGAYRPVRP